MACRSYEKGNIRTTPLLPFTYNVLPVTVLLILLLFVFGLKKKWQAAGSILFLGLQFPLIFLTAPAMFFMYYYCLYLCGHVLLFALLLRGTERK